MGQNTQSSDKGNIILHIFLYLNIEFVWVCLQRKLEYDATYLLVFKASV